MRRISIGQPLFLLLESLPPQRPCGVLTTIKRKEVDMTVSAGISGQKACILLDGDTTLGYSNTGKSNKEGGIMRITSKGQVTIPLEMRDKAGLLPGTDVEFAFEDGKLCVSKSEQGTRGRRVVERMRGKGSIRMTTDEIMALTRA
jgi:AbrB family looped-hinge helix DNA binding protein